MTRPFNAKPFFDKKVGDTLYSGDLDDGFGESIIIAKDKDGFCIVIQSQTMSEELRPLYACDWHYSSMQEAIRQQAKSDIEYYSPKLEFASKALSAANDDDDLSDFVKGYEHR